MNAKVFLGAVLLLGVLLAVGASAHVHPPHVCDNEHPTGVCPAGETCGVTGQAWGDTEFWKCPGGYESPTCEQWQRHFLWYHHHLEDQYGCIAPAAIPPPSPQVSYYSPMTITECQQVISNPRPLDDINPATLPLLDLTNTRVRLDASVPQGFLDCVILSWYGNGEKSCNGNEPPEYYNLQQLKHALYGQHAVCEAMYPTQAIRVTVVKDELCDSATPVHILLKDSHDHVGLDVTTTARVYDELFRLPDDFAGCPAPIS